MRALWLFALALPLPLLAGDPLAAQGRETHVTIPYLANASAPESLDYAAATCEIAADGRSMQCRFRQVFITPTAMDPTNCAITSNGYEQRFLLVRAGEWTSDEQQGGECGLVETTTLRDGGATRWTMTVSTKATEHLDRATCRAAGTTESWDYRTLRRRLPCATIQPGAIER